MNGIGGMDELKRNGSMGAEEAVRLVMPLCDRVVNSEVSVDYTLPDYQPEIRRLLYVAPTVLPPAKYIGGGTVEMNGTVDLQGMYVGADGGLYSLPLSGEYGFTVPLEQTGEFDLNEGVTALVSTVCEPVNARVTSPRKVSMRCRMRSHVRVFGQMSAETEYSGSAEPQSILRLWGEAQNAQIAANISEPIRLCEEIGGMTEDTRVISADGAVLIGEIRPGEGTVSVSGDVMLHLMIGRENGATEWIHRRLPLSGEIELDGMEADSTCRATGTVSDITVNVEEGRILCEVDVLLEARGFCNRSVRYTEDLYSTEVESVCERKEYALPIALRCENRNLSQSERIPLEGLNIPEGASVVGVWGSVQPEQCTQEGEKLILSGQSRYVLLCEREGEYSVAEVTLPLRYETEGGEVPMTGFDATAEVISCRARTDGETLNLDAELSVVADFMGTDCIHTVSAVRFGEAVESNDHRMVVYYPSEEDTAWTVAKRYHVSPDRITENTAYYIL